MYVYMYTYIYIYIYRSEAGGGGGVPRREVDLSYLSTDPRYSIYLLY
jgi:hypothetical protein